MKKKMAAASVNAIDLILNWPQKMLDVIMNYVLQDVKREEEKKYERETGLCGFYLQFRHIRFCAILLQSTTNKILFNCPKDFFFEQPRNKVDKLNEKFS